VTEPLRQDPAGDERRPLLRIRPAPDTEPPFDAEPQWTRPNLAVPDQHQPELPIVWKRRRRKTSLGVRCAARATLGGGAGGSPEARRAAHYFLTLYREVLHGLRPPRHLARLSTPDGLGHLTGDLGAPGPRRSRPSRLQSLHVAEPQAGIAEVAAVLDDGDRAWAVALRFERHDGSWLCAYFRSV
jgi:hypothetical protein